jgi:hypothetical protein
MWKGRPRHARPIEAGRRWLGISGGISVFGGRPWRPRTSAQETRDSLAMTLPIQGARRVMETTDPDVVNQYLRFGWKLINQYVVQERTDSLPVIHYALASVRMLEETKEVITLCDTAEVNAYLALGWRMIDKYVTGEIEGPRRESLHFVLAWQSEDPPSRPGGEVEQAVSELARHLAVDIEVDRN